MCLTRLLRPETAFGSLAVTLVQLAVTVVQLAVAVVHLAAAEVHLAVAVGLAGHFGRLP